MNVLPATYTICAYMRLSVEDRDVFGRKVESGSITSQRRLIMDFINKQPEFAKCRVIERCDDGLSGRYFDTRPQFTEMIELAKKGKINCIIVKDCSRFGRDYVELGDYLEQLFPFLGIRFIAINDHYDSDKNEGGLDIAFKNLVYDIYSRDLSKKVKESRRRMASQGKYIAGQTLYGYRKMKKNKYQLEIDSEAAEVVREIFDMRLAGMGLTDIAKTLNDRGIKCPTAYKHQNGEPTTKSEGFENMYWTSSTVLIILNNEIYTGTFVALKAGADRASGKLKTKPKEEWVRIEGTHKAIVTKKEFQQVQDMIQPQHKGKRKRMMRYRCGCCGRRLTRRNRTSLYCSMGYFLDEECECRKVKANESKLDRIVLEQLKQKLMRVLDAEELKLSGKDTGVVGNNLDSIKNALEAVKKAKQMLFEKLADRSIDRETFKEKKREYDEEIAELEQRLSDANMSEMLLREAEDDARAKADMAKTFLDVEVMTDEIWEKFLQDVFVYPGGRMEIHWNFDDENEQALGA